MTFFRTRSTSPGAVRLHRNSEATTTGVFRCDIPDASGDLQSLYVGIYFAYSYTGGILYIEEQHVKFLLSGQYETRGEGGGGGGVLVLVTEKTCMLCIVTNMSLKYNIVRPLKFHFLFVVLQVIENDQVIQV